MAHGRLITIEGLDGAGKSTLAAGLGEALRARGVEVQIMREPGGVQAAERIRELVKDPSTQIGGRAEALLYAAARAQLVEEEVKPLLDRGGWVVLDRFVDSSLAYQGGGRQLGIDAVRRINDFGTGGLVPDRTLLLRIDLSVGRRRSRDRAEPVDRLEGEADAFFDRIAEAYDELASGEPGRFREIDAGQTPDEVLAASLRALEDLL